MGEFETLAAEFGVIGHSLESTLPSGGSKSCNSFGEGHGGLSRSSAEWWQRSTCCNISPETDDAGLRILPIRPLYLLCLPLVVGLFR